MIKLKSLLSEAKTGLKTYRVGCEIPGAGWERSVQARSPEEAKKIGDKLERNPNKRADYAYEDPSNIVHQGADDMDLEKVKRAKAAYDAAESKRDEAWKMATHATGPNVVEADKRLVLAKKAANAAYIAWDKAEEEVLKQTRFHTGGQAWKERW